MIGYALERYDNGEIEQALFHPLTQAVIDTFVDAQLRVGPPLGHLLDERDGDRLIQGRGQAHGYAAAGVRGQFVLQTFELSHDGLAELAHQLARMSNVHSLWSTNQQLLSDRHLQQTQRSGESRL